MPYTVWKVSKYKDFSGPPFPIFGFKGTLMQIWKSLHIYVYK